MSETPMTIEEGIRTALKIREDRIAKLEAALRAIKRGAVWNADIEVFISAALEAD